VKGDGVTFIVGNINLNGGKLWLITGAATHVQLKVKRLRGEGAICLQTSDQPQFSAIQIDVTNNKSDTVTFYR
ncbi:hypothetical protein ACUODJ_61265, partial [Escherichia sp. HC-CC]